LIVSAPRTATPTRVVQLRTSWRASQMCGFADNPVRRPSRHLRLGHELHRPRRAFSGRPRSERHEAFANAERHSLSARADAEFFEHGGEMIFVAAYLDERVHRLNNRGLNDRGRFVDVVKAIVDRRLTYLDLIGTDLSLATT